MQPLGPGIGLTYKVSHKALKNFFPLLLIAFNKARSRGRDRETPGLFYFLSGQALVNLS